MFKYYPYCTAKNIFDIDIIFYKYHGIKYVFVDLDNTLDPAHQKYPSERVFSLVKLYKENDIEPIILSNNSKKRIGDYCKDLNINFVYKCYKPFTYKVKKYINSKKIDINSVIIIGDQVITDIMCANNLNVKSVLTEKLVKKEALITVFNHMFDNFFKNKLKKKDLLKDWRTTINANYQKN